MRKIKGFVSIKNIIWGQNRGKYTVKTAITKLLNVTLHMEIERGYFE